MNNESAHTIFVLSKGELYRDIRTPYQLVQRVYCTTCRSITRQYIFLHTDRESLQELRSGVCTQCQTICSHDEY